MTDANDMGKLLRGTFPTESDVRQAEIVALSQVTDTLNRMGNFMANLAEEQKSVSGKLALMHTDIEVIKSENRQSVELRLKVKSLEDKITAIELVHAEQKGAGKFAIIIKDFTPWILAIMLAVWGFFGRVKG